MPGSEQNLRNRIHMKPRGAQRIRYPFTLGEIWQAFAKQSLASELHNCGFHNDEASHPAPWQALAAVNYVTQTMDKKLSGAVRQLSTGDEAASRAQGPVGLIRANWADRRRMLGVARSCAHGTPATGRWDIRG
jgi:hypothetical protein